MTQNARGREQIRNLPCVISLRVEETAGLHGHPLWCGEISSLFLSLNRGHPRRCSLYNYAPPHGAWEASALTNHTADTHRALK